MLEWLEEVGAQMEAGAEIANEAKEKMDAIPACWWALSFYKIIWMSILYGHVATFWFAYYMGLFK